MYSYFLTAYISDNLGVVLIGNNRTSYDMLFLGTIVFEKLSALIRFCYIIYVIFINNTI
jgi:hypothetical protein